MTDYDAIKEKIGGANRVIVSFSDLSGRAYNVSLLNRPGEEQKIIDQIEGSIVGGKVKGYLPTDGSSFPGFDKDTSDSDMIIAADLDTLTAYTRKEKLPSGGVKEEKVAHVWADIRNPDGSEYDCCPRTILRRAVSAAKENGLIFKAGSEQEFFVSRQSGKLDHIDDLIYYQDVPVWLADCARNSMRERGLDTVYIHHEVAGSQFEILVKYKDALAKADDFFVYKTALREAAALEGLSVTFMPKPQDGINGSGMHVHWGLFDSQGNNIMEGSRESGFSEKGEAVVAALLKHAKESSIVHNPTINSYRRLKPGYEAPTMVCWGKRNRTAMLRRPAPGGRIENRVLDGVGSPYLKFAVMIHASLRGLESPSAYSLEDPVEQNVFHSEVIQERGLVAVPQDFGKAIDAARKSSLLRDALGSRAMDKYLLMREKEWSEYQDALRECESDKEKDRKGLELELKRYWDA
ncbi:glutamine synthetase [Candidatus Woesearchaeota archaeon]|nr:glutamine synthetase [Candidatus Woesearchaeota archaeon]